MSSLIFLSVCVIYTYGQVVNIPLQGSVNQGEFWAPLALGTPPQSFKLQIDTGSADLLVYSVGCTGCGNQAKFNPAKSNSGSRVSCDDPEYNCAQSGCSGGFCDFDDRYGDGSHVSGLVYTDVFTIGSLAANISFGNIEDSSPNFEPQGVDGIWGLAWYTISDWNGTSAFQNVVNQLGLADRFLMCLIPDVPVMQLGGPSSDDGIQYTPVIQQSYYVVTMESLSVAGTALNVPSSMWNDNAPGCIVDSGTTLMLIPTPVYPKLFQAFQAQCSQVNLPGVCGVTINKSIFANGGASVCAKMSQSQIDAFPAVGVTLDGTSDLVISGADYLMETQSGCYSMGIAASGATGPTILGDVFMQAFLVVFDRTNMQVGFGDVTNCPSPMRNETIHITY